MDQGSAYLDLSLSQRAHPHETVPAGDGLNFQWTGFPAFICLHPRCEVSFPTAKLLEAHAIVHAKGKQTPTAASDFSITGGDGSPQRLHPSFGKIPPIYYTAPFGTFNDTPTGFRDPSHGWPNPFDPVGISGNDYTDPVHHMPSSTLPAIGDGAITQEFDPSGIASHGPYAYGHSQLAIAAPPPTHAVAQTSNVANTPGSTQPGVVCAKCGTHVKRQSDLGRHMKRHQPNAQVFRCQFQGCQYSSKRKDKVMEHSRRPH